VYIEPLEKGTILTKAQVNTLFSNWRLLLGVNKELLKQLENVIERPQELETPADPPYIDYNELDVGNSTWVRVTFFTERATKTLLVSTTDTSATVVQNAIRKIIASLPAEEQTPFLDRYKNFELYDEGKIYEQNLPLLSQIPDLDPDNPPHVYIRRAAPRATTIGECFLQMVF
jgi:hypothetical protein